MGDVFSFLKNSTLSRSELNYESGKFKYIHYGDILTKFGDITDTCNFSVPFVTTPEKVIKLEKYFLQNGDVIIADTAEDSMVGKVTEIQNSDPFPTVSGLHTIPVRPNKEFAAGFLGHYMNAPFYHDQLFKLMQGVKVLSLSKNAVIQTKINSPSYCEQNLISRTIDLIDGTITLHEEKKRQLERLKSALLQKMFADKSGYPAVRFKGFDDIWNQEKLNSLVRLHRGLTYSPNNVQDSGIRVLRSSNILDGKFVMTDDDIFVKSSVVNIPTVKNGDILITAANGSIKLVGKHAIISGISENTAVSGGFMLVGSSRIPNFVNSLFGTSWYQRFIRKYVTGGNGSIGNLKKNDFDKQYVMVPTTSEQERIGEFLKKIDQLIINNQIKHEKLLELKKSLLQNMFI